MIFENLTAKNSKEVLGEVKLCFWAVDLNRSFGFATDPRISCRRDEGAGSEQVVHRVNEGCHPDTVKVTAEISSDSPISESSRSVLSMPYFSISLRA